MVGSRYIVSNPGVWNSELYTANLCGFQGERVIQLFQLETTPYTFII